MNTTLHIILFYLLLAIPLLLLLIRPNWPRQDAKQVERPVKGGLTWVDAVIVLIITTAGGLGLSTFVPIPSIFQLWEIVVALFWYWVLRRRFPVGKFDWHGVKQWLPLWLVYAFVAICSGLIEMGDTSRITPLSILHSGLIVGLGEELIFRGVIQTGLTNTFPQYLGSKRFPVRLGTLLAALVFGLFHLINLLYASSILGVILLQVPFTFVLGLLIGQYYDRTGKMWGAVVTHSINDLLDLVVRPIWPF